MLQKRLSFKGTACFLPSFSLFLILALICSFLLHVFFNQRTLLPENEDNSRAATKERDESKSKPYHPNNYLDKLKSKSWYICTFETWCHYTSCHTLITVLWEERPWSRRLRETTPSFLANRNHKIIPKLLE